MLEDEEEERKIASWNTWSEEEILKGIGTTRRSHEPRDVVIETKWYDELEIIGIVATCCKGWGGVMGKFPIRDESLISPTPTLS